MHEIKYVEREMFDCFPIITENASSEFWYYWLRLSPLEELSEIQDILMIPSCELDDEKKNKLLKYNTRRRIGNLMTQQKTQHIFSLDEQQEVLKYTQENSIEELMNDKLKYFSKEEKDDIKNKIKKMFF